MMADKERESGSNPCCRPTLIMLMTIALVGLAIRTKSKNPNQCRSYIRVKITVFNSLVSIYLIRLMK